MNKNKTRITALAVIVILIITIAVVISTRQQDESVNNPQESEMILFYSLSCPHCQNVSDHIRENNIKDKYSFNELEISENQKNSAELVKKAKECNYNTEALGVPFLWTGDSCLMGDVSIIEFFQP
ncbi:MAG: hypothetical protein PHE20_00530 [Patescibacteria group bacterium]|nr:hypothetical protein [Patescibacteria group bacterium]